MNGLRPAAVHSRMASDTFSCRAKQHSSGEISSPRRPSSPLSGMVSAFSRNASAPERSGGAAWILLITKQCMRVYPASAAVLGSRTTCAKHKVDCELASGTVIATPGTSPVAVAWSETSGLHVCFVHAFLVHHVPSAMPWLNVFAVQQVAATRSDRRACAL